MLRKNLKSISQLEHFKGQLDYIQNQIYFNMCKGLLCNPKCYANFSSKMNVFFISIVEYFDTL